MMIRSFCRTAFSMAALSVALSSAEQFGAGQAIPQERVAGTQQVAFDLYLPIQHRPQMELLLQDLHNPRSANFRRWLKPAEFEARFGPSAQQMQAVQRQLAAEGLTATVKNAHELHVAGPAAAIEQVLGTQLRTGRYADGSITTMAAGQITTAGAMSEIGAMVIGLSGAMPMRSHAMPNVLPDNRNSPTGDYWFDDLKQAYSFPSYQTYTGAGVTIGILGSGDFNPPDMDLYFGHENLATPSFSTVQVDGGAAYSPTGSFETHLDLQQSGGMAPNANILLYNMPDLSLPHMIDGLLEILLENQADVVSMSFGTAELYLTPAYQGGTDYTYLFKIVDDLFAQGNTQGISFIASSGDQGALGALPVSCTGRPVANCGAFLPAVEFPASSPNVTGVGGTNLTTTYTGVTGDLNSAYISEEAFADPLKSDIFYGTTATGAIWGSGGGDSVLFRKPVFQKLAHTGSPNRTVPDVAMHMGGCPIGAVTPCKASDSGDIDVIDGKTVGAVGTSAAAPDFAGLTALAIQRFGTRLGNENFYIYALALAQETGVLSGDVFRTGIRGNNGLHHTHPTGYSRVLGNGTVDGVNFMLAPETPTAGIPQTPSNP